MASQLGTEEDGLLRVYVMHRHKGLPRIRRLLLQLFCSDLSAGPGNAEPGSDCKWRRPVLS